MNAPASTNTAFGSGVCAHSSPSSNKTYAIFEVGREAMADRFESWAKALGIGYKRLVGSYEGEVNAAFIMDRTDLWLVDAAGWLIRQESILVLGPLKDETTGRPMGSRSARLVYLDGRPDLALGRFRPTTPEFAMTQPGWTFDPASGVYFVALEKPAGAVAA